MKIKLLLYLLLAFSFYFSSTIGQTTDSLKVEISQEKNKVRKIKLLKQLAETYSQQGTGKAALKVFNEILSLAKTDSLLLAQTYNEIGNVEADQGVSAQALKSYQTALKFTHETNYALLALINKNIGALYLSWRKFEEALKYDTIAEEFAVKAKDYRIVADLANNKGAVYEQQLLFDKAGKSYQKALNYYIREKINDRICLTYNNLAILSKVQKKYSESAKHYALAVEFANKIDNKWLEAAIGNNFGNLLSEMGQYDKSDQELQKALKLEQEINAGELIPETLENLADNEKRRGNFKAAFDYMKLTAEAKNKFINLENTKEIAKLQEEFEVGVKQRKIELLNKESKIHQLTMSKKNTTIALIVGVFVALGLISSLAFSKYRLRQENRMKLAKAETKNQIQEEKLRISQELHDNIGAQLSFINGSIQRLAAADSGNEQLQQTQQITQNTIKELRSTVWLINQQNFCLEEFVIKLREYLKPYYGSKPSINIVSKSEQDCKLEPIVATHLFRVIQEAINNAIKYADATEVTIVFNMLEGLLTVSIADDGVGFDIVAKVSGYGLKNMASRIKNIHGTHQIFSNVGGGTQIKIEIPIIV